MSLRSTTRAWGWILRTFHWGMLLILAVTIPLGLYMTDLPLGPYKVRMYALHKSIGLSLLGLVLLRALWRASESRPMEPPMPKWQSRVASATAFSLYALLFAIPLSGWLFNSAAGFPLSWFGITNLPPLTATNPSLKIVARATHEFLAWTLMLLVALHAAAALKHHFVDRDRTLSQMLPWLKNPESEPKK